MARATSLYGLFALALILNLLLWTVTYRMQPLWPNVPPAPTAQGAPLLGLGDSELAYRTLAYQLQLMGNEAGVSTPLYQYDYARLEGWFKTLHHLNEKSEYVPYIAAYYFGATQDPKRQLVHVLNYLEMAGLVPLPGKWQWLVQAAYGAYHKKGDHDLAMRYASELAALPGQVPFWARQMSAILAGASGDKKSAVIMMKSILQATLNDPIQKADPVSVNFMVDFICRRMLSPAEAALDTLCTIPSLSPLK